MWAECNLGRAGNMTIDGLVNNRQNFFPKLACFSPLHHRAPRTWWVVCYQPTTSMLRLSSRTKREKERELLSSRVGAASAWARLVTAVLLW